MHIAASLMTTMARPSCTTMRLFGASHCHVLPLRPTLPNRCGPPGAGDRHLATVPQGGGGASLGWGTTWGGVPYKAPVPPPPLLHLRTTASVPRSVGRMGPAAQGTDP